MDLSKTLLQLRLQKERVERAIIELEQLQGDYAGGKSGAAASQRGRKSMGIEERDDVSERMKRYWAGRRGESANGGSAK